MPSDAGGDDIDDEEWSAMLASLAGTHARLFFRLAYGIVRDREEADDIVQVAFLRAWERRTEITDPSSVRAWIGAVVVNESLATVRRRRLERKFREGGGTLLNGGDAATVDAADNANRADLRDKLLDAIQGLPETARLVLMLRDIHELSGNGVKDLLGCSASEVSRHLHEGRRLLREALGQYDDGKLGESR